MANGQTSSVGTFDRRFLQAPIGSGQPVETVPGGQAPTVGRSALSNVRPPSANDADDAKRQQQEFQQMERDAAEAFQSLVLSRDNQMRGGAGPSEFFVILEQQLIETARVWKETRRAAGKDTAGVDRRLAAVLAGFPQVSITNTVVPGTSRVVRTEGREKPEVVVGALGTAAPGAAPTIEGQLQSRNPDAPRTGPAPPEIIRLQAARDDAVRSGNSEAAQELQARIDKMGRGTSTRVDVPGPFGVTTVESGDLGPADKQAPNRFGKPIPEAAQKSLSGSFVGLDNIDIMEKNISESGILDGPISEAQVFLGFNQEAINFDTARTQNISNAQDIIKGIPSNFDVKNFIKTQPKLTLPEIVNRARIGANRRILKQMIADRIAFFKFSGFRIPDRVIEQAGQRGIDVGSIKPFSPGPGKIDPFENSIVLINETVKETGESATDELTTENISKMGLDQLGRLDLKALSEEQATAADKRLKELGF